MIVYFSPLSGIKGALPFLVDEMGSKEDIQMEDRELVPDLTSTIPQTSSPCPLEAQVDGTLGQPKCKQSAPESRAWERGLCPQKSVHSCPKNSRPTGRTGRPNELRLLVVSFLLGKRNKHFCGGKRNNELIDGYPIPKSLFT